MPYKFWTQDCNIHQTEFLARPTDFRFTGSYNHVSKGCLMCAVFQPLLGWVRKVLSLSDRQPIQPVLGLSPCVGMSSPVLYLVSILLFCLKCVWHKCQDFILFYGWVVFYFIYASTSLSLFIHPLMDTSICVFLRQRKTNTTISCICGI